MTRLPYPGLRAYTREETDLFFGREGCVNEMIERLAAARFLAVLGASGSGKSSLVRTGLLDGLELGLYAAAGSDWAIADMHPGGDPLNNLAHALLEARGTPNPDPLDAEALEAYLASGPLSIARWLDDGNLPPGRNLLILVDQFEELFRYSGYAGREQAEGFVALLLESGQRDRRIHVAITMRSEYLGACALIPGLAQAINAGLYLTRRMSREECKQAIVGPAGVIDFEIAPALVTRILNDLASVAPWAQDREDSQIQRLSRQADQLPLMQHALSRLWQVAEQHRKEGEKTCLTLADYESVGELRGALKQHADEVMASLSDKARPMVRPVFRALVAGTTLADAVRRPRSLDDLVAIAGGDGESVREVVDAFRAPGCNFLRPSAPQMITGASVIDISHESLIRQWNDLSEWFEEEARAGALWKRLADSRDRHAAGRGDLQTGHDLAHALEWRDSEKPNRAWAESHGGQFDEVFAYLKESRAAWQAAQEAAVRQSEAAREAEWLRQERKLLRIGAGIFVCLFLIAAAAAGYGFWQAGVARVAQGEEAAARAAAEVARAEAANAREAAIEAEVQRAETEALAARGFEARLLASLADAERSAGRAREALKLALVAWPRTGRPDMLQFWFVAESASKSMQAVDQQNYEVSNTVNAVAFSPDGGRIVTASADGAALVFDLATGSQTALLVGHEGEVNAAAFSPDGGKVATGLASGKAFVFDAETGDRLTEIETDEYGGVLGISFSPSGDTVVLAVATSKTGIYSANSGALLHELDGHTDWIRTAVFSPDGTSVLTASDDGTARMFSTGTGELLQVLTGHTDYVRAARYSPDGTKVATASDDTTVHIYDLDTEQPPEWGTERQPVAALQGHTGWVMDVQFSPNGKTLLSVARDNAPRLWDVGTGSQTAVLEGHGDWVRSGAFSPDGTRIVTASDDRTARVFVAVDGRQLLQLTGHAKSLTAAAFSPDGTRIVTASADGTSRIWNAGSGKELERLNSVDVDGVIEHIGRLYRVEAHDQTVNTVRFSADMTRLVTASTDKTASIWDTAACEADSRCKPLMTIEHEASVRSATFSPDGRQVLTASSSGDEPVRLWDISGEQPVAVRRFASGDMYADFSPDGRRIVTAGSDNDFVAVIWDASSGEPLREFRGHAGAIWTAVFNADGSRLATAAEDGTARLWDVSTGNLLHAFHHNEDGAATTKVWSAHFSPDGKVLVTTDNDGFIVRWDVATGTRLHVFKPAENAPWEARFSADGKWLAVGTSRDIRILDAFAFADVTRRRFDGDTSSDGVMSVQFSPDNSRIAGALNGGGFMIVDIGETVNDDIFTLACKLLGDDTNLDDVGARYRLAKVAPICGEHPPHRLDPEKLRLQ